MAITICFYTIFAFDFQAKATRFRYKSVVINQGDFGDFTF